ncbi:MAG: competence protein ComEA [Acidimicrobiaceae bacterium]
MPDDPQSSQIEPFRPLPDPSMRERVDAVIDRLRALSTLSRAALALAVSAGALVVAIVVLRPAGADPAPEETLPRASAPEASASAPPASSSGTLVIVQAAGAVVRPGLYRLAPGARVDDLIRAAGGLAPDADPDRVNLAALLADGEKVYVPRVGEDVPADSSAGAGSSPAPKLVDLNTASIADLDTLPGIGPATAQAIIDYRSQHGRFRSVDELLNVRGIGQTKLDELRPLVRV